MGLHSDGCGPQNDNCEKEISRVRQRKYMKTQVSENFNMTNLAEMMLERLKGLLEEELASLATVIATCGLNAALAEVESDKKHDLDCSADYDSDLHARGRMSTFEAGSVSNSSMDGRMRLKMAETELPSLDKFLVKRLTRLEREVLEAKNARKSEAKEGNKQKLDNKSDGDRLSSLDNTSSAHKNPDSGSNLQGTSSMFEQEIAEANKKSGEMIKEDHKLFNKDTSASDLGTILVKHSSKLEKEVKEARTNQICSTTNSKKLERRCYGKKDATELPGLDKFLVKHVSRLEKEVQEAKNRRNFQPLEGDKVTESGMASSFTPCGSPEDIISCSVRDTPVVNKNIDLNKNVDGEDGCNKREQVLKADEELSHEGEGEDENNGSKQAGNCYDKIFVKPDHVGQMDRVEESSLRSHCNIQKHMSCGGNGKTDFESLDKVLVKQMSRLEREKMEFHAKEEALMIFNRRDTNKELDKSGQESLDQVLVKHKSRLEREKMAATVQHSEDQISYSVSRREARQKEMEEAWGGLSLGNSMRPHLSRLQRDKATVQQSEDQISYSVARREARQKEMEEAWGGLSLGNSMGSHLSRLQRDKANVQQSEDQISDSVARRDSRQKELEEAWGGLSLGNSMRPHLSRLQRDKATVQQSEDQISDSVARRDSRQKELEEAWGGLSLGNSMRPHLSRLQKDKAAWLKAEEEERRKAMEIS